MPKKVLFCATVDYHFKAFHLPYLKWFKEQGWEVHIAANGKEEIPYVDKRFNIPFTRSPYSVENIKAYYNLKKLMANTKYEVMHFHIPVSATLGRIAAINYRKYGTKVIYTSHGHYYYKGGPLLSWLLYYPIEKLLARFTDCLITINEEDYQLSLNKQRSAKRIEKVHGMGVDLRRFTPPDEEEKKQLRSKHGFSDNHFILIYPAELNANKNQKVLIDAVSLLKEDIPNIKLLLVGRGVLLDEYMRIAEIKGVSNHIHFLGFRRDVDELIKLSDVSVASSIREGLGINIIEGMACGKPIVAVDNRGHRELVEEGINGFLTMNDASDFSKKIMTIYKSRKLAKKLAQASIERARLYSVNEAGSRMIDIYESITMNDYLKDDLLIKIN